MSWVSSVTYESELCVFIFCSFDFPPRENGADSILDLGVLDTPEKAQVSVCTRRSPAIVCPPHCCLKVSLPQAYVVFAMVTWVRSPSRPYSRRTGRGTDPPAAWWTWSWMTLTTGTTTPLCSTSQANGGSTPHGRARIRRPGSTASATSAGKDLTFSPSLLRFQRP